jgi:hypothetical protein
MTSHTSTVAGALAERMTARVLAYRHAIARVARGERLTREESEDVNAAMRVMGLPRYAFRRDVAALVEASRATGYRLAELAANHWHLFSDPAEWVAERAARIARRRNAS